MAKSTISNGQQGLSVRNALNAMFTDLYGANVHHVVGNWYMPFEGTLQTGGAPTAGTIRLIPFVVGETITISDLGARVSVLSAAGNFQLAIYNSRSQTDFRPGTVAGSTGNLSTAATGVITGDITGADITLTPGLYWAAINVDNATAAFTQLTNTSTTTARRVGSSTVTDVLQAGADASRMALSFTQTFGTWPDLTAQTLGVTNNHAVVVYKVSAVA